MFLQVIHVFDPAAVPGGACMGPTAAVAALAACTERLRDALRCDPGLMDVAFAAAKLSFLSSKQQAPEAAGASKVSLHGECVRRDIRALGTYRYRHSSFV